MKFAFDSQISHQYFKDANHCFQMVLVGVTMALHSDLIEGQNRVPILLIVEYQFMATDQ